MITLTRCDLQWVARALQHEVNHYRDQSDGYQGPDAIIALSINRLESIISTLDAAIDGQDKRIAIK